MNVATQIPPEEFELHSHLGLFFTVPNQRELQPLAQCRPELFGELAFILGMTEQQPLWMATAQRLAQAKEIGQATTAIFLYLPPQSEASQALASSKVALPPSLSLGSGQKELPIILMQQSSDAAAMRQAFEEHEIHDLLQLSPEAPFIDLDLLAKLWQDHRHYLAEYSYNENVPRGFMGSFIHRTIRYRFDQGDLPSQYSVSEIVRKNINQFDLEVHFTQPDIRLWRAHGTMEPGIEEVITRRILNQKQKIPSYADFAQIIQKEPSITRVGPTYIELELTTRCQLDCLFCPRHSYTPNRPDISSALVDTLIAEFSQQSLPLALALGGLGEPLMHPNFLDIVRRLASITNLKRIFVETNGLLLTPDLSRELEALREKIHIIINLSAMTQEAYTELHRPDDAQTFTTVISHLNWLSENIADLADFATLQILKIRQTEEIIDSFHKKWQDKGFHVLLQKQNTFAGAVQDFRFSDLTPLERFPCWHLKRDMVIWSDGNVPVCKQELAGDHVLGQIADNKGEGQLSVLWERGKAFAQGEAKGDYSLMEKCGACDEWYTFNY